ncbi:MAG: hypothetical protein ABF631_05800, partial [Liquorilactobacillus nagelii]|uniref:hypothetical protein n=1 Tax=Liquorilactobacillus nagelii TaxID=82688 RepID=UPI0039E95BA2
LLVGDGLLMLKNVFLIATATAAINSGLLLGSCSRCNVAPACLIIEINNIRVNKLDYLLYQW